RRSTGVRGGGAPRRSNGRSSFRRLEATRKLTANEAVGGPNSFSPRLRAGRLPETRTFSPRPLVATPTGHSRTYTLDLGTQAHIVDIATKQKRRHRLRYSVTAPGWYPVGTRAGLGTNVGETFR